MLLPSLIQRQNLIEAHPTREAVTELLIHYIDYAGKNPHRAKELASALASVNNSESPDTPMFSGSYYSTLAAVFSIELSHLHDASSSEFDDDNTS